MFYLNLEQNWKWGRNNNMKWPFIFIQNFWFKLKYIKLCIDFLHLHFSDFCQAPGPGSGPCLVLKWS